MNAPSKPSHSLRFLAVTLLVVAVATLGAAGWHSASVSARTAVETFTITPSAGAHGTITPPVAQTIAAGGGVTFTMQPDIGFHVADVKVDDVSVGALDSYLFEDVQADHTISATFARDVEGSFVIVPSAGLNGQITPPIPQTIVAGSDITFDIIPDPGFKVLDVLVDGTSVGAMTSYQFTNVRADHTLSATFQVDTQLTYVITPDPGANGQITPPVPQTVAAGSDIAFDIIPDPGFKVLDVLVDGTSVGAMTSYQFTNVRADHTLSATFQVDTQLTYVITPDPGANGQITPPVPQTVAADGSITFTIVPDAGYHVADVFVDGTSVGARTSYQFTNVRADHTLSATFQVDTQLTYLITPQAGEHGQISPPVPQSVLPGGSVTFAMVSDTGYHLADVRVDGVSIGAPSSYTFTNVNADHTIGATFAKDTPPPPAAYTITPSSGEHGHITPTGPQSVTAGGSITFAIVADAGYHVNDVLVDGASVGPRGSYQFTNVQADHVIAASFAEDSGPTLTVTSPAQSEKLIAGRQLIVAWTLDGAVSTGRFTVRAVPSSGAAVSLTPSPVPVEAGKTDYRVTFSVAVPAPRLYRIKVRYESDAGVVRSEAAANGSVTVLPKVKATVSAPGAGASWRRGSSHLVRWSLSSVVVAGEFRVTAVSASGRTFRVTPVRKPVAADATRKAYSTRWKVDAKAGTGYRIVVEYWWTGMKLATGKSGRLTITAK